MNLLIDTLKLYSVIKVLKNHWLNKAVLMSGKGHNQRIHLFFTETKFRNSQATNSAGKDVPSKGLSNLKNLFTAEAFTENDVIRWLLEFDWEINIVNSGVHSSLGGL